MDCNKLPIKGDWRDLRRCGRFVVHQRYSVICVVVGKVYAYSLRQPFATRIRLYFLYPPHPSAQAIQHTNGRYSGRTSLIAAATAANGDITSASDFADALFGEQQDPAVSEGMKASCRDIRVAERIICHLGLTVKLPIGLGHPLSTLWALFALLP